MSAAVPPLSSISSVLGKVARQYEGALQANSIFFYPSKVTVLSQNLEGSSSSSIPWTIRCVPALLDKAKEKRNEQTSKNEQSTKQQNPQDVFAPPYHPDLLVEELPRHTVLLNKFCVVPKHFLLVTKEFESQNVPPSPETLTVAYKFLYSHKQDNVGGRGKELLGFYNCGQLSGASQPHQHLQFAEVGGESEDSNGENENAIPIESLLSRIPKDGREDEVYALPLPFQHFVSLIKDPPSIDDTSRLQIYLGSKLMSLLDAQFQARRSQAASSDTNTNQRASPSWNLLITTRAMHLIPRQQEEFHGLLEKVKEEGVEHKEDGVDLVGSLSINSLGYAGHLLVKSEKELEYLQSHPGGVTEVLRQTGCPPVNDVTTAVHHED